MHHSHGGAALLPLYRNFGEDLTETVVLDLVVDCLVDVKTKRREPVDIRVEVGVVAWAVESFPLARQTRQARYQGLR